MQVLNPKKRSRRYQNIYSDWWQRERQQRAQKQEELAQQALRQHTRHNVLINNAVYSDRKV
jgi:hypothetical protein